MELARVSASCQPNAGSIAAEWSLTAGRRALRKRWSGELEPLTLAVWLLWNPLRPRNAACLVHSGSVFIRFEIPGR